MPREPVDFRLGDYRDNPCPEDAALTLVDPPYGLGKRYEDHDDTKPFAEHVRELVAWNRAPWMLVLGPHPTMPEWLHLVPRPSRVIYWHRTFVLPRRGLKTWTESLTPILVYGDGPWYGLTGNQRTQHDLIDAHSSMGDVGRLKRLGIRVKHPGATGTSLPSKLIPLLTKPGELVVDPMAGIASVLVAARRLARRAAGTEVSKVYHDAGTAWLAGEAT